MPGIGGGFPGPPNVMAQTATTAAVPETLNVARSFFTTARRSLRNDVRRAQDLAPALDLRLHELRQILRAAARRRDDLQAQTFEALADRGIVEHVVHGFCHLLHDRIRRALRKEQRVPDARLDARQALLAGRREIRDDRRAPRG